MVSGLEIPRNDVVDHFLVQTNRRECLADTMVDVVEGHALAQHICVVPVAEDECSMTDERRRFIADLPTCEEGEGCGSMDEWLLEETSLQLAGQRMHRLAYGNAGSVEGVAVDLIAKLRR